MTHIYKYYVILSFFFQSSNFLYEGLDIWLGHDNIKHLPFSNYRWYFEFDFLLVSSPGIFIIVVQQQQHYQSTQMSLWVLSMEESEYYVFWWRSITEESDCVIWFFFSLFLSLVSIFLRRFFLLVYAWLH